MKRLSVADVSDAVCDVGIVSSRRVAGVLFICMSEAV